jgi:hypothetical protein
MRGQSLYVQTTKAINDHLGYDSNILYIPLSQYISDSGVKDNEQINKIKARLHNYRFKNKHKRAALTQKEIAYIDHQVKLTTLNIPSATVSEVKAALKELKARISTQESQKCPRGLHDEPCNCQETKRAWFNPATGTSSEVIQKPPEPLYNYITITDHLELLIGKTVKHETFPLEGTITNIDNENITIKFNNDFAGKHTTILLTEADGLLIKQPTQS